MRSSEGSRAFQKYNFDFAAPTESQVMNFKSVAKIKQLVFPS